MLPRFAIITAGGKGIRMNNPLPKQFLLINGKPVLMYTIEVFARLIAPEKIVLVLPAMQTNFWQSLCNEHQFHLPVKLAEGGPTRFHSVKNGLRLVPNDAIVGIHDGVRPLVSENTIAQAYKMTEKLGNAIPVVPVTESVRVIENAFNKPMDRESLRLVQTPQCFRASDIKKAYEVPYDEAFTDDASVLEKTGARIYLSNGNVDNIKITTTADLVIAEAILAGKDLSAS